MPTIIGPSSSVPGAVDYMLDNGSVVPLDPKVIRDLQMQHGTLGAASIVGSIPLGMADRAPPQQPQIMPIEAVRSYQPPPQRRAGDPDTISHFAPLLGGPPKAALQNPANVAYGAQTADDRQLRAPAAMEPKVFAAPTASVPTRLTRQMQALTPPATITERVANAQTDPQAQMSQQVQQQTYVPGQKARIPGADRTEFDRLMAMQGGR